MPRFVPAAVAANKSLKPTPLRRFLEPAGRSGIIGSGKPAQRRGLALVLGMPRNRTALEAAAGKLISAIQREWVAEAGVSTSDISEHTMNSAHELLAAARHGSLEELLAGRTVTDFLGPLWVRRHPGVIAAIRALESAQLGGQHA